jgi:hypothetical protein
LAGESISHAVDIGSQPMMRFCYCDTVLIIDAGSSGEWFPAMVAISFVKQKLLVLNMP